MKSFMKVRSYFPSKPAAHRFSTRKTRVFGFLAIFISALFLSSLVAQPAGAQAETVTRANPVTREAPRRIDLSVGKSIQIDLPRDVKDVLVANPKIANAVVRSIRDIFIIGIADGTTSVFAMDASGNQIAAFDITVGRDLNILRQTLRTAMPGTQISVQSSGDSVLLVGSVATASEASQAADIANAFVGNEGGAGSSGKVINALTIRGKDQVMIKVSVIEVRRTVLKTLGVNSTGSWEIGKLTVGNASGLSLVENPYSTLTNNTLTASNSNGSLTLRALEQAGVLRTLAEPTLTAISGETASFLVGGEVPIQAGYRCDLSGMCTQTIEFKKFGVSLTFTPIVMSEGRMSLRIATEVSEIDPINSFKLENGAVIPGFKVRRSDTTVELPSGGTLVTAGLIQQQTRQGVAGIPGLKNLPILGTLFRSREYERQETELMLMVTPFIVAPILPRAVSRPDDGFVEASDPQATLLGRFNKIYGAPRTGSKAQAAPSGKPLARPGFIND